ncbi:MAG: NAD(P)H-hydrate dehydratase [Clostridiales bacterium]|nr:NAD(P)H-hydrate dehydratase [Clostridiales bacterium]
MRQVLDAQAMKWLDDYTINNIGIPSMVLMERAALSVATCIKEHVTKADKILALAGTGNNGADAIAAGRILKQQGYDVDIVLVGNKEKCSLESRNQINIARNLGISLYNNVDIKEYNVIIDGLLGIGLNQPVRSEFLDYIKAINQADKKVFSIDLPSGICATSGRVLGQAIRADYTITFGYNKIGLILYPGCEYAGQVIVSDIGFPRIEELEECNLKHKYKYYIYDNSDLARLPMRKNDSHKGDYGRVLVIAGSKGMNGACYLTSLAAYRSGSGLVKALIPEDNEIAMQALLPEVILSTYERTNRLNDKDKDNIVKELEWADVIALGPGFGKDEISFEILSLVLNKSRVPLVIDADGINILSEILTSKLITNNNNIEERIGLLREILPKDTILTPHIKELSRLLNIEVSEIKDDIFNVINACTKNNHITFIAKDARTVVAYENDRFINTSGNSGMSTGGSGDVLTGIIASLIGQGLSPREGAVLGVYIHGLAGDTYSREKNQFSLIARDIIDGLAKI